MSTNGNKLYRISNIINRNASIAEENCYQMFKYLIKDTSFDNKLFVSGGYVRDLVKNIQSNDLDLVIEKENGAKQFCNYIINLLDGFVAYEKLNPNYPTFKLTFKDNITINNKIFNIKDASIDISDSLKIRFAQDSGKEVLFENGNLFEDAMQRDFTMNSLFLSISTDEIIDYTQLGISDIKNNILRLIPNRDNEKIVYNNPKILIRYCRFYAKYKMNFLKDDIQILKKHSDRIETISDEGIQKEIKKINNDDIKYAKEMMKKIDIWEKIKNRIINL